MSFIPHHIPSLTHREAIIDCVHRCITAFDLADWPLFQSAVHPSAIFIMNGTTFTGIDEIRSNLFDPIAFGMDTTHMVSDLRIHLMQDEQTARVGAMAITQHFRKGDGMKFVPGANFWGGASYEMEVVRDENVSERGEVKGEPQWKLKYWKLEGTWGQGDVGIVLYDGKEREG